MIGSDVYDRVTVRAPFSDVDRLFDADADRLDARRIRLFLFANGAHVDLTGDDVEQVLATIDSPAVSGDGYALALLWRLAVHAPNVAVATAIEQRILSDYPDGAHTALTRHSR